MTEQRLQEIERSIGVIDCPDCEQGRVFRDGTFEDGPEFDKCETCNGSGMVSQFPPAHELIAEIRRLCAERDTQASPVLAFHQWAERRVTAGAAPFTQAEFAVAMEAFYAAHPGEGPHSTLMAEQRDTLPPLPEGWRLTVDQPGDYMEWTGDNSLIVWVDGHGVGIDGALDNFNPADLITVLRHAEREHQRMKAGGVR